MKASNMYAPTLREVPAEAEIISHQLMMRSGMLRKVASGVYTYMPLAWRTMKKIMEIIREEMDAAGGQELLMPAMQPAELWQQSGRWDVYGAELWRVKDRNMRDFCLGPTHEEIITYHFHNDIRSYKQLPQRLYQIQTKFRDERRPRFGLMRGREFMMKDMYSFDRDEQGLAVSYQLMHQAYTNIFTRCGLNFRPVEADTGAIGGSGSHEFMALAETGESAIVYCDKCNYAASVEIASLPPVGTGAGEEFKEIVKVYTPDCTTIEDVANLLGVTPQRVVKTLCFSADGEVVMVLIRGDRRISEVKLKNALGCNELEMASDDAVRAKGLFPGYLGPIGVTNMKIVADSEVPLMVNHECGANEVYNHLINVNYQRGDYRIDLVADLREVAPGEPCPHCDGTLLGARGIEVGQIFKLRDKYSKALGAYFTDENGEDKPVIMGCYGIGVGRTMAAIIEQSNDEYGIIWPMAVAPYHVVIVPVNDKEEALAEAAETLYQQLLAERVEVVLDDRKERPGVKFNDADLIGYPLRVIIGSKGLAKGIVEVKIRATGETLEIPKDEIKDWVLNTLREAGVR